jgi:hypothetical protein
VNGGAYELQGDGKGGLLSDVLSRGVVSGPIYKPLHIATVAGQTSATHEALMDSGAIASALQAFCLLTGVVNPADPNNIAGNYTSSGFKILMGGESDGVVPLTSALVNVASTPDNTLFRVHSIGVAEEGFGPPHLQQGPGPQNIWVAAGFDDPVAKVLSLLNTTYSNIVFRVDLP